MDFSLRSVRRPTVHSIPTAPFSFQHSTFVLGEVCRLDPSGLSRLDRLRLRRPCLLPLLRAPCRCLCGFISRRSPFVELVVRFLSALALFLRCFFQPLSIHTFFDRLFLSGLAPLFVSAPFLLFDGFLGHVPPVLRIVDPEKQIQRSVLIDLRLMAAVLALKAISPAIFSGCVAALRAML